MQEIIRKLSEQETALIAKSMEELRLQNYRVARVLITEAQSINQTVARLMSAQQRYGIDMRFPMPTYAEVASI